jgi:hypothetical protein
MSNVMFLSFLTQSNSDSNAHFESVKKCDFVTEEAL